MCCWLYDAVNFFLFLASLSILLIVCLGELVLVLMSNWFFFLSDVLFWCVFINHYLKLLRKFCLLKLCLSYLSAWFFWNWILVHSVKCGSIFIHSLPPWLTVVLALFIYQLVTPFPLIFSDNFDIHQLSLCTWQCFWAFSIFFLNQSTEVLLNTKICTL